MDDATLAVWHCAGVCEKADYLKSIGWSAEKIRREGPADEFNELGDPGLEALLMNCVGLRLGDLVEGEDGLLEVVEGGYHFDSAWGGNKMGVKLSKAYESKERGDRRSYLAGWFGIACDLYYMVSPFGPFYRETGARRSLLEVAFSIFQKLAVEEYPQAARWVGFMHQCGYGTEVDYEKAANIFRWLYQNRSLDDKDEMVTESAMFLAQILYHKMARPEDGFRLFEALSNRDPRSAFYAGSHLFKNSDLAGAIRYFRVASDGGHKEAFTYLGRALIMNSKENPSDLSEGLRWLEKAAQEGSYEYPKGDPWALYWQAILYNYGTYGVPVDRAKANALLEEAVRRPGADYQTPDPEILRKVEELKRETDSRSANDPLEKVGKFFNWVSEL
jgi:TPR repeat protein